MKPIYKFILYQQIFFFYACISSFNNCSTKKEILKSKGLNPSYLSRNDKILSELYGKEEEKEAAIDELKEECNSGEAHSCYNLSVFFYLNSEFESSNLFSKKATDLLPEDNLYFEMFRLTMIKLKKNLETNNSILNLYTQIETHCRNKNSKDVIDGLQKLITSNSISKQGIKNGIFNTCLTNNEIQKLSQAANESKFNYSKIYYSQKEKNNPFQEIWDTGYIYKDSSLENEKEIEKPLSKTWQKFRNSVREKNQGKALEYLKEFIALLENLKEKDKKNEKKYVHLKLAAKLLIEQDSFYNLNSLKEVVKD